MEKNEVDKNLKSRPKRTATGEPVDQIIIEPSMKQIAGDGDIAQEAVVTFGKFNPPHAGHARLVEHIKQLAEERGAEAKVFISRTPGALTYNQKLDFCRSAFGRKIVTEVASNDLFQILQDMNDYKRVALVVGSDRYSEFADRLPKYFNNVEVIEFEREGESSTALREAIWEGDYETFYESLPVSLHSRADELFSLIHDQTSKPTTSPSVLRERAINYARRLTDIDTEEALRRYAKVVDQDKPEPVLVGMGRRRKIKHILDTGAA